MFYTIFSTSLGWIGLLGSPDGLRGLVLPQPSSQTVEYILCQAKAIPDHAFFDDLPQRLNCYFAGKQVVFNDQLDICKATAFQQRVWQAVRCIPYGQTRSYQWLAQQVGSPKAARAVGQALAANPVPILIPCHRVISSEGKLGGFSGGLDLKRCILDIEQAHI